MHASAQPLVLRSSRAHQRTHSKTRPCTRTHDTHAYTHPAEEAARVAGTGQVDPSCTVPGQASDALEHEQGATMPEFPEEAARVAGTGQVDPSCTVPGQASDALEFPEEKKNDLLIEYAKKGATGGVLMALQAGADVNHKDKDSRTALHWAAEKGLEALAQGCWAQGRTSTRKATGGGPRSTTPQGTTSPRLPRCCWRTGPKSMRATIVVAPRSTTPHGTTTSRLPRCCWRTGPASILATNTMIHR
jgi:hypothetical protein